MNLVIVLPGLETSYLISVLVLTVVFGALLLLVKFMTVLWLNDTLLFGNSSPSTPVKIPKVKMMTVNIPFTFRLEENPKSTYQGLHCIVSSQVCYRLEAFWGVNIRELHLFLREPWDCKNISCLKETPLDGQYQEVSDIIRDQCHESRTLTLELSKCSLNLGTPPRQCYPLVVFLVRDTSDELLPDETVALVNVVHICDNVCTMPTSLLAQYLKQANGRLTSLKQLYIASENTINYESDFETTKGNIEPVCVVCQVFPISRALLPCRHTCICVACFNKIKACPLCRSPIKSYFNIRNEDYFTEPDKSSFCTNNGTFSQWLQDRITDFLGFER